MSLFLRPDFRTTSRAPLVFSGLVPPGPLLLLTHLRPLGGAVFSDSATAFRISEGLAELLQTAHSFVEANTCALDAVIPFASFASDVSGQLRENSD